MNRSLERNRNAIAAAVSDLVLNATRRGELSYAGSLVDAINRAIDTDDEALIVALCDLFAGAVAIEDRQARMEFIRDEGARLLKASKEKGST